MSSFEKLMKDKFQMSSMGELTFFLGLQVQQKEDGIFISQDKYVAEILKKFNYSDVKSASTPVDLEKPLVKDGDADDVDVHLYRSMIGSLMYLTASRPDIMDSPFELVAYTDSDYAGATQDRKSTTRAEYVAATNCCGQVKHVEYLMLNASLFEVMFKKKVNGLDSQCISKEVGTPRYLSLVVLLTKVGDEAVHKELVTAVRLKLVLPVFVSAIKHMLMLPVQVSTATAKVQTFNGVRQLQALVDKKRVIITKSSIRRDLHLDDAEDHPTDSTPIPIIDQPSSSSQPKKKQPSKKAPRQEVEIPQVEAEHEESVPTPSNDLQPSGIGCSSKGIAGSGSKEEDYSEVRKGRSIEDIDADVDVSLVDETQERQDDDLMFDTGVLEDDEMHVEAKVDGKEEQSTKPDDSTAGEAVTTASVDDSVVPTTIEEITLAQTLIQIKAAKPKVVTTAATTTTTTRPKDKGVVVQEPSEFRVPQETQPSSSKDKGKEEQKLARKQEEEANIALIESWENTQAMMEADRLLAERLQSKEREELTDEEKAKLFMELMEKRRKHFAALRAQEKRNRPPTKAQKRTQMSTYLKHMGRYTYKQLKGKSFDEIQKLFDKEMKRVNTFVAMGSEVQERKENKEEGREETTKGSRKKMLGRKRAGKEQQKESSKKQKVKEEKESEEVDEIDEAELKKLLVIKKDEDIAIDAIPLATKLPVIIDYKLHKEGMLVHYQLIRADGSSKRYSSMIRMLQGIDKEDLEALWRIVKAKYGDTRPDNEFERVLWGDLKVMFEPDKRSDVWRILQGYRVTI
ncbi:uncharacterized mitochondrial protein-like protein [Tanacetum coccineum]